VGAVHRAPQGEEKACALTREYHTTQRLPGCSALAIDWSATSGTRPRPVTSVRALARLSLGPRDASIVQVHLLKTDAEGWDGLILNNGSRALLESRTVQTFIFEYHG
jgi:hypothetical protein